MVTAPNQHTPVAIRPGPADDDSQTRTAIPLACPRVGDAEIEAAVGVLRSGELAQGREVAAFESEFSAIVGERSCVAVSSGTAALHLALLALGIGAGDEVVVPSFTFGATVNAVAITGATPVFADIDPRTFCLDPAAVAAAITPRTAAVVPVHLFGHPAAMDHLLPLAERHGLAVVEDAAQAVGATLHGQPVGSCGDAACFSFYPTKNMHSIEGGMVVTSDRGVAHRLRLLRNHGMEHRYRYEVVGINGRMNDVAAAVGRVQLRSLPNATAARRANAAYLDHRLRMVVTPTCTPSVQHAYHQYTVRVSGNRAELRRRLAEAGIGTAIFYPEPVHRTPAHRQPADLSHTDRAAGDVLSLPVHPALTNGDLARIVSAANA